MFTKRTKNLGIVMCFDNSNISIGRKSIADATANQIAHTRSCHNPYASAILIITYSIAETLRNQRFALLILDNVLMKISG